MLKTSFVEGNLSICSSYFPLIDFKRQIHRNVLKQLDELIFSVNIDTINMPYYITYFGNDRMYSYTVEKKKIEIENTLLQHVYFL